MTAADSLVCVMLATAYTTMLRDVLAGSRPKLLRLLLACPAWILYIVAPVLMYGHVRDPMLFVQRDSVS